jgi:hypothetical protein
VQARKAETMMEQTLMEQALMEQALMEQCGKQLLPGLWSQLALALIALA